MPAAAASAQFQAPPRARGASSRAQRPALLRAPSDAGPAIVQAIGARVWSEDGAEYIDFDNAGGAVLMGHRDPDVVAAMRLARSADERRGPERFKRDVAERLLALVSGADTAVFGSDVSQVLRAALTCARGVTGRQQVWICRSIAWRAGGRPPSFAFDDLEALERLLDEHGPTTAALVLAPCGSEAPSADYLPAVRALADRHGVLLIFDETRAGILALEGGGQSLFGVRADLAVFGESLSNGAPFGALVGGEILRDSALSLGHELSTDLASLAAAKAVLVKCDLQPVLVMLRVAGRALQTGLDRIIIDAGLEDVIETVGDPARGRLALHPALMNQLPAFSLLWARECLAHHLFNLCAFNISYAQGDAEIAAALIACEQAADCLSRALRQGPFQSPGGLVQGDK